MPDLKEIFELSGKKECAADASQPPVKPRPVLYTILVIAFFLAGLLLVIASWLLCLNMIVDDHVLFPCLRLVVLAGPSVCWALVFLLTKKKSAAVRSRIRTTSLIGFVLAVGVAYIGLLPWAFFAAAFRNVRM